VVLKVVEYMGIPYLNIQMGIRRLKISPGPDCWVMRFHIRAETAKVYRNVVIGLVIDERPRPQRI
jgi:hypothetical protein